MSGDQIQVNLANVIKLLYSRGFKNLVVVDKDKKPLHGMSWSSSEPIPLSELLELAKDRDARGVAIVPSVYADPKYNVLILDIDDVDKANPLLASAVGDNWLEILCGQPDSFCGLSGPRCPYDGAKKDIVCTTHAVLKGDYRCTHVGADHPEFNLSEAKRGMYIVVRYPADVRIEGSIRNSGVIELLRTNYQVVYGLHPSNVPYQTFRVEDGELVPISISKAGAGVVVSRDVVSNIVTVVSAGKPLPEALAGNEAEASVEASNLPEPVLGLTEEQINRLIEYGKPFMRMRLKSGQHLHDLFLFGLSCVLRRMGVKYDDARRIIEGILDYSVSVGEDTERDKTNHLKQTVDWVYKPGNKRLWGVRRFREVMLNLLNDVEDETGGNIKEGGKLLIEQILNTLGVNEDEAVVGCVPSQAEHQPQLGVFKVTHWLCNDREMGVSHVYIKPPKKPKDKNVEVDNLEALASYTYVKKRLLDIYINKLNYYKDVIFGTTYVKVDYVVLGRHGPLMPGEYSNKLMVEDDFVELISRKHVVNRSPDWRTILHSVKPIIDVIVSGFACPPPNYGLRCGIRDYFDVGLNIEPDLNKAVKFVENALFGAPARLHPEPHKWRAGIIFGSMLNFALTQKLYGYKTFMLTLVGTTNSGKTTIGRIMNWAFAPRVNTVLSASDSVTPARIGRVSASIQAVGTFPITFDEFSRVSSDLMSIVLSTLRSYVTSLKAWSTATGEKYPATFGVIVTSNTLPPSFINSMRDKIIMIEYANALSYESINAIHDVIENDIRETAVHFGVSFLRFMADKWPQLSRFILNSRWPDYVLDVFNEYLKYIGVPQRLTWNDVYRPGVTIEADMIVPVLFEMIWNTLEPHRTCRDHESDGQSSVDYVRCTINKIRNYALPYITEAPFTLVEYYREVTGNRDVDPKSLFIIKRNIEGRLGVGIETICTKLGGVLYRGSGSYRRSCVITEETLEDLLRLNLTGPEESEPESESESGDSNSSDNDSGS